MIEAIGPVKARAGEIVYGSLEFEGHKLPVVIAAGKKDGPTFLALGLQHAGEFSGPAAIDRVLRELDLGALSGTLVCLPVANPLQVGLDRDQFAGLHKNPETNLNRQWPGSAESDNQFSRLAALLWKEAVTKADALLDFHCCGSVDPRFAAALEGHKTSEALARAVGLPAIDLQTAESYAQGLLFVKAAEKLDIPAVLIESYPGGFQIKEAVADCSAALFRGLVHAGMLESAPPPPAATEAPAIFRRSEPAAKLEPTTGGYLAVWRWPGERARKGQAVVAVRSLETFEVLEQLESPLDAGVGSAGLRSGAGLAKPGDVAATVKPCS